MVSPTTQMSMSGNTYVDAILWGGWHWLSPNISYFFDNDTSVWASVEINAFRDALDAWAAVANLNFTQVGSASLANLVVHSVSAANMPGGPGVFGRFDTPDTAVSDGQSEGYFNYEQYGSPIYNNVPHWYAPGLNVGGYGYLTYLHELGHGLGLAHPHDHGGGSGLFPGVSNSSDTGSHHLNQGVFTVMSYNDGWQRGQHPYDNGVADHGYAATPAAFDIAAIQYLYGANMSTNAGDTVYTLRNQGNWVAIWDVGGHDTIRYNGSADVTINLNSATLDNSASGGGVPSYVHNSPGHRYYGGFTIAADFTNVLPDQNAERGVIIEDAIGGFGNDRLVGNMVANRLVGRGGDDRLIGMGGNDHEIGGAGRDVLNGAYGRDVLNGGGGHDVLRGGAGQDVLRGGAGSDVLQGGSGNDVLNGGNGADYFVFQAHGGQDQVVGFTNDVDTLRLDDALWGGGLTPRQVLNTFATDTGSDILFDFGGGNTLLVQNVANVHALLNDLVII